MRMRMPARNDGNREKVAHYLNKILERRSETRG